MLGKRLDAIAPDRATVAKLLATAERNLADAYLAGLSAENKFVAVYRAVIQLTVIALRANGYRTLTSVPGQHPTAIQTHTLTVGLRRENARSLDVFRKQRNLSDYSGDLVPDPIVTECVTSATMPMAHVKALPQANTLDLLSN